MLYELLCERMKVDKQPAARNVWPGGLAAYDALTFVSAAIRPRRSIAHGRFIGDVTDSMCLPTQPAAAVCRCMSPNFDSPNKLMLHLTS